MIKQELEAILTAVEGVDVSTQTALLMVEDIKRDITAKIYSMERASKRAERKRAQAEEFGPRGIESDMVRESRDEYAGFNARILDILER